MKRSLFSRFASTVQESQGTFGLFVPALVAKRSGPGQGLIKTACILKKSLHFPKINYNGMSFEPRLRNQQRHVGNKYYAGYDSPTLAKVTDSLARESSRTLARHRIAFGAVAMTLRVALNDENTVRSA